MPLNKQKGNMYPFVTHTWNAIKGKCPHDCLYCYMKKWGTKMKPLRLVKAELRDKFESGQFIFIGSSTDMWLAPDEMIEAVMDKCLKYPDVKYLFQTKDPSRFRKWLNVFYQMKAILACTIESDINYPLISNAPYQDKRYLAFCQIDYPHKMVSIEPVMDFNTERFLKWIDHIRPLFVSIGANTNSAVKLQEPSSEKLQGFIDKLSSITEIVQKKNLKRLLPDIQGGVSSSHE